MNIADLKPASALTHKYGVKALLYGPPGVGKTPLINTAPNPVLLACEPGLLSMRNSPVPTFEATTNVLIKDFFRWFFESQESNKFDTLAIDSISQLAEIFLAQAQKTNKDGRMAYGDMSRETMDIATKLYYKKDKHIILLAKQITVDEGGTQKRKPYFPGQDLNVKIPHLFDGIFWLGKTIIPGVPTPQKAIRTAESFDLLARDRSGRLNEYEQPDLNNLFNKAMS